MSKTVENTTGTLIAVHGPSLNFNVEAITGKGRGKYLVSLNKGKATTQDSFEGMVRGVAEALASDDVDVAKQDTRNGRLTLHVIPDSFADKDLDNLATNIQRNRF